MNVNFYENNFFVNLKQDLFLTRKKISYTKFIRFSNAIFGNVLISDLGLTEF